MRKSFFKNILPVASLLISGCTFKDFTNKVSSLFKGSESSSKQEEKKEPTEKLIIPESLPLTIGQTKDLSLSTSPDTFNPNEINWTSSDSSVASVNGNKVTGLKAGRAKVTATAKNGKGETIKGECSVVVTDPNVINKSPLNYTYEDYQKYNASGSQYFPLSGSPKLLVIPIWFNDSDSFISEFKTEDVREDIRKSIFGTDQETGWKSLKTFYEEESKGKMSVSGTVADWYEIDKSHEYYGDKNDGLGYTMTLVEKASTAFFTNNPSENRTDYDTNGDGYLDAVLLIYGSPDFRSMWRYDLSNLWAYRYHLNLSASLSNPVAGDFFWASYDFMYSYGDNAFSKTGKSVYGYGDTRGLKIDAHTYIHEMGHILGLPDFYDYSGMHTPAGSFSMQDLDIGGHDAYSVMAFGWGDPYIPQETMTITINDFQSSHDVILLANGSVDSPFDEYMLLELYTPTGLNELDCEYDYMYSYPHGPNKTGIRLWHVDARLTQWKNYSWSTKLITDPTEGMVTHAMTNAYYLKDSDTNGYISPLGKAYDKYNHLQLIRCDGATGHLNEGSLFGLNSEFTTSKYKSQFAKGLKLDNGYYLGWKFTVDAIDENSASITVTRT